MKIKKDLESKKCPRCGRINPPKTKLCVQCLGPLDLKTAIEVGEKRADADNLLVSFSRCPESRRHWHSRWTKSAGLRSWLRY